MDQQVVTDFLKLVRCAMQSQTPRLDPEQVNWQEVFRLAQAHQLGVMIAYPALELVNDPASSVFRLGMQAIGSGLAQQQAQSRLLEQMRLSFPALQIPFLPLKGSLLRSMYPKPEMRTMCDLDILLHKEDLEKAGQWLKENGFEQEEGFDHDVPYTKLPYLHVELHYRLFSENTSASLSRFFASVWDQAQPKEEGSWEYRLSPEWFAAYLTAHFAKHVFGSGSGARSVLDLWLFQKQVPLEEKKLFALLDKLNLSQFYRRMIRLGECWMEGTPCPEELKQVQDYILQSGVYGTEEHRVLAQSAQAESKGKHLLLRFCPPLKEMRYHFPVLQRLPVLLPFCWVGRWVRVLKKGTGNFRREMEVLKTLSPEEMEENRKLMAQLGLSRFRA